MVLIHKNRKKFPTFLLYCSFWFAALVVFFWMYPVSLFNSSDLPREGTLAKESTSVCPYMKLSDLTPEEYSPRAGKRHMVDPPKGGVVTLVCCTTTVGPWNIAVHQAWAPIGAQRFLDMVKSKYFHKKVPLMRCVKNFLCQFGLAGESSKEFGQALDDDPNWLPQGKEHRENAQGVKRFAKGYFAYAGAGSRTRSNQLIVTLKENGPLAGGSPWEVPWGELVGSHSFDTLDKIYTGYGENGPSQGLLHRAGALEVVERDFPNLDFVLGCSVVDQENQNT